jgi:hypothetical protein
MALSQDNDATYLYDVDSELFEGAHIFPLQYYELVRCSYIVRGGLTVLAFRSVGQKRTFKYRKRPILGSRRIRKQHHRYALYECD